MKNIFINKSIKNDLTEVSEIEFGCDKFIKKSAVLNRLIDIWDNTSDKVKNYIIKCESNEAGLGVDKLGEPKFGISFGKYNGFIRDKYFNFKGSLPPIFQWGNSKAINIIVINYFIEK